MSYIIKHEFKLSSETENQINATSKTAQQDGTLGIIITEGHKPFII